MSDIVMRGIIYPYEKEKADTRVTVSQLVRRDDLLLAGKKEARRMLQAHFNVITDTLIEETMKELYPIVDPNIQQKQEEQT